MRVQILFFGVLKDLAGKAGDLAEMPEGATVGDVLAQLEERIPRLKDSVGSLAVAVNREYAVAGTKLHADDEVALLPPVSGGSGDRVSIIRAPIDTQGVLARIKRGEDGAAVVFEGVVRNSTRGRRTLYLDYEAYEEMAHKEMNSLAERALKEFQIRDVCLVHRLGRLEIGETSVLIVVASAHRAAAFDACRWLIDTLKRTVPIWKKEYFEDGAVWADGEPFPAEVARGNSDGKSEDLGSPTAEGASK
jgi:molybdopterin synthase catalytic subunit/molybdopterin converting factor small subunit